MKPLLARVLRSGSAWGLVSLGIRAASAAVLIPLTAHQVPTKELGLWYIFVNVFAFVMVLDAGLSATIGRLVAAHPDFSSRESAPTAESLKFFGTIRRFYAWIGPATFLLLALAGGWSVWAKSSPGDAVRMAWLAFCPSFALAVCANLGRGLLFGINRLDLYNMLSTLAAALQFVVVVTGLLHGGGIYALIVGNLVLMGMLALMLPLFLRLAPGARAALIHGSYDKAAAAPMLRVTGGAFLNTVASYCVQNASLLIASMSLPLHVTASYGLTLQCVMLANQASCVWQEIKFPVYARMLAENPASMHRLFIARMRLFLATFLVCLAGLAAFGNQLLGLIGAQTFLLPTGQLLVLGAFVLILSHQAQFELVSLCIGKNPFTRSLLIFALAGVIGVWALTPRFGLWGTLLAPFVLQLSCNNWWVPLRGMRLIGLRPRDYAQGLLMFNPDTTRS